MSKGLGQQAQIITPKQEKVLLTHVVTTRHPARNRVMVLLSMKAGLRAKEIASLTWSMVCDAEGEVGDSIRLVNGASKGKSGGRVVPLNPELRQALVELHAVAPSTSAEAPVVTSERGGRMSAQVVINWFQRLYGDLGFAGCSSHSGRRTFITRAARKVSEVGGSLRDVQQLAGHASLQDTQKYIEGDTEAKRKLVGLL